MKRFKIIVGALLALVTVASLATYPGGTPLLQANNLSDVANTGTSRTNLGLGTAATQNIAFFLQTANNLSDLASPTTARTNLGLGTAATQNSTAFAQTANNLSDLANATTARTNLGLGTAATQATTTFLQVANNLSDLNSATTARTNLGLGTAATQASTVFLQVANNLSDLNNAGTARTNLGLGTAATSASTAFLPSASAATLNVNGGSLPSPVSGTVLQMAAANSSSTAIEINSFAGASSLNFFRASGTAASPTAVTNGSAIGMTQAYAYGTTGYSSAARTEIVHRANQTWSDTVQGAGLEFYVTATGGTTTQQAAYIEPGGIQIGPNNAVSTSTVGAALGMNKMTASGSAPGAGNGIRLEAVCGTNAGSMKIIAYAGTSTTPTTVIDNVGAGNTGC